MFLLIHFSACMAVHFLLAEDSPRRCVSERESPVGQPEKESEGGLPKEGSPPSSFPLPSAGWGREDKTSQKERGKKAASRWTEGGTKGAERDHGGEPRGQGEIIVVYAAD